MGIEKKIAIYLDEGVSREGVNILFKRLRESNRAFFPISSKEIKAGKLESASLFILGGGRDLPYHRKLKGEGTKKIRTFVENGGHYLGICAGAYFGSAEVDFDRGFSLEVLGKRELSFFPGKAIGPAYGKNTFRYQSYKGAKAAKIQPVHAPFFYSYYNGGCYFEGAAQNASTKILARYEDLEDKPAAIIECPIGKGKAILSGIHLEYSFNDFSLTNRELKKIYPKIQETERTRALFFKSLLTEIFTADF